MVVVAASLLHKQRGMRAGEKAAAQGRQRGSPGGLRLVKRVKAGPGLGPRRGSEDALSQGPRRTTSKSLGTINLLQAV